MRSNSVVRFHFGMWNGSGHGELIVRYVGGRRRADGASNEPVDRYFISWGGVRLA